MPIRKSSARILVTLILIGFTLIITACTELGEEAIDEVADDLMTAEPTLFPSPTQEPSATPTPKPVRRVSFADESDDVFHCTTGEPVSGFALLDLSEVTLEVDGNQLKVSFAFHGVEGLKNEIGAQGSYFAVAAREENSAGTDPLELRGMFGMGTQYLDIKYAGGTWLSGIAQRTNGEFQPTGEPVEVELTEDMLVAYGPPGWGPALGERLGFGVHGIDACDVIGMGYAISESGDLMWESLDLTLPEGWSPPVTN
jgi:hypothetical protein